MSFERYKILISVEFSQSGTECSVVVPVGREGEEIRHSW